MKLINRRWMEENNGAKKNAGSYFIKDGPCISASLAELSPRGKICTKQTHCFSSDMTMLKSIKH